MSYGRLLPVSCMGLAVASEFALPLRFTTAPARIGPASHSLRTSQHFPRMSDSPHSAHFLWGCGPGNCCSVEFCV